MKQRTILIAVVALTALMTAPALAGSPPDRQTTDVMAFADFGDVGQANLLRTKSGATATAKAGGIPAGIYTMWWVVWNNPEGCATPYQCGEGDLFDAEGDTGLAVGYAAGAVVGHKGKLTIAAHLREGQSLEGFPYPEFGAVGVSLTETTLVDSEHAEIHLVLRSHEDRLPGMVGTQLRTFNGGCVYDPPINGSEPAYGEPGPNTCSDEFFAVFPSIDTP
jgi:hypothetical protein